jgi:phenylpropionate dioxygenase-like ring-hydroxylating dioxygenase large terminal subunit
VKNNTVSDPDILRFPHPVFASRLLKKDVKQITLMGKKYVLYRDNENRPVALPDVCPHRGSLLSKGKRNGSGELVCAYHAWRINSTGQVTCPSVPKRSCKIALLKTWEKYGFIWIANADVPEEDFPEFALPGYEMAGGFSTLFKAPLPVVLDNFSEIEHAFQVHTFIGPQKKTLNTVNFSVDIQPDKTFGYLSCTYRHLPFFMRCFFGIRKNDLYHNDWEFKFRPLHGSYQNYWTSAANNERRPVSFIVTSFLVPVTEKEVNVQVFVQIKIENRFLRLIAPVLKWSTMLITRFEIRADSDIARFAPESSSDGNLWRLTYLDKQIMANRKRMDTIYFFRDEGSDASYIPVTNDKKVNMGT